MKKDIRYQLRDIAGITYEYNESGTVVRYWEVDIFKLNNTDGGIELAYVGNLSQLSQEAEEKIVHLFKCYLGWD